MGFFFSPKLENLHMVVSKTAQFQWLSTCLNVLLTLPTNVMAPVQSGRWMSMNQVPIKFCYLAQRQGSIWEDDWKIIKVCLYFEIKVLCNFNVSGSFDLRMCLSVRARVCYYWQNTFNSKFTTIMVLPSTCVLRTLYWGRDCMIHTRRVFPTLSQLTFT